MSLLIVLGIAAFVAIVLIVKRHVGGKDSSSRLNGVWFRHEIREKTDCRHDD